MAYADNITLVASNSVSASVSETAGTAVTGVDKYRRGNFVLATSSGTGSGSFTLDCAIQAYVNGYWSDVARFAQVTSGATERILWDVGGTVGTSSTIEEATQSLDITVGTKRAGPLGTQLRARYTIVITGTYSFTWTVVGTMHS